MPTEVTICLGLRQSIAPIHHQLRYQSPPQPLWVSICIRVFYSHQRPQRQSRNNNNNRIHNHPNSPKHNNTTNQIPILHPIRWFRTTPNQYRSIHRTRTLICFRLILHRQTDTIQTRKQTWRVIRTVSIPQISSGRPQRTLRHGCAILTTIVLTNSSETIRWKRYFVSCWQILLLYGMTLTVCPRPNKMTGQRWKRPFCQDTRRQNFWNIG